MYNHKIERNVDILLNNIKKIETKYMEKRHVLDDNIYYKYNIKKYSQFVLNYRKTLDRNKKKNKNRYCYNIDYQLQRGKINEERLDSNFEREFNFDNYDERYVSDLNSGYIVRPPPPIPYGTIPLINSNNNDNSNNDINNNNSNDNSNNNTDMDSGGESDAKMEVLSETNGNMADIDVKTNKEKAKKGIEIGYIDDSDAFLINLKNNKENIQAKNASEILTLKQNRRRIKNGVKKGDKNRIGKAMARKKRDEKLLKKINKIKINDRKRSKKNNRKIESNNQKVDLSKRINCDVGSVEVDLNENCIILRSRKVEKRQD